MFAFVLQGCLDFFGVVFPFWVAGWGGGWRVLSMLSVVKIAHCAAGLRACTRQVSEIVGT